MKIVSLASWLLLASCASRPIYSNGDVQSGSSPLTKPIYDRFLSSNKQDPSLRLGFFTVPPQADDAPLEGAPNWKEKLLRDIREKVAPESWSNEARWLGISDDGLYLVAFQTESVIHDLETFCQNYFAIAPAREPQSDAPFLRIATTILSMPEDSFAQTLESIGLDLSPEQMTLLDDQSFRHVRHALNRSAGVTRIQAPRVTTRDREKANIRIGENLRFLVDYVECFRNGQKQWTPVTDTFFDGMTLDLLGTLSEDKKYITVDLELSLTEVLQNRRIQTTRGEIDLPLTRNNSLKKNWSAPDGAFTLIEGPAVKGRKLVLIVESRRQQEG